MLVFLVACILVVLTLPLWISLLALAGRAIAFVLPLALFVGFVAYVASRLA